MQLLLLSRPAIEPLTLADVKNWLKVTDGADDLLLQTLIASARLAVEAATGRLMISQQWRLTLDAWPTGGAVDLRLMPVRSVLAVRVMDVSAAFKDIPATLYALDAADDRARLIFNAAPPAPACAYGGIQIDLVAGYGDAAAAAPEPLRLAMRQLIAFWHANRGDAEPQPERMPAQIAALLAPYRIRRLV